MRISDWSSDGALPISKSKARVQAYESLLAVAADKAPEPGSISIPAGPRLGDLVIEAQNVTKAFGDKLLIDDLSFKIPPGAIVGIKIGRASCRERVCQYV